MNVHRRLLIKSIFLSGVLTLALVSKTVHSSDITIAGRKIINSAGDDSMKSTGGFYLYQSCLRKALKFIDNSQVLIDDTI